MIPRKRGRSALSRHLAERAAQRDQPDATATPTTVTAPGPAPEATRVGKKRKARRTKMDAYLDQIGMLPDARAPRSRG